MEFISVGSFNVQICKPSLKRKLSIRDIDNESEWRAIETKS